jgi:putative addiction module killer protein
LEILRYLTRSGVDVFGTWLSALHDERTRAKVVGRITRLAAGNFGDCKALGGGVSEQRIDWGPGYRVYFAMTGRTVVLLLCGGDKSTQKSDIKRATEYWADYKRRTKRP